MNNTIEWTKQVEWSKKRNAQKKVEWTTWKMNELNKTGMNKKNINEQNNEWTKNRNEQKKRNEQKMRNEQHKLNVQKTKA